MKKIYGLFLILALFSVSAFAALDAFDSVTVKVLSQPIAVNAAAITNTAVDISAAKGIANLMVYQSAAYTNCATYTNTVTLQKSTASAGTYSAVTSVVVTAYAGTGTVSSIKLDVASLSRYLRLIVNTVGDTGEGGAVLIYPK
jgi:hypothetical protein